MKTELDENYAMIECDNIQGGYLAGQELVKKGSKKIGFVCYGGEFSTTKKRIQGLKRALEEAGQELDMACGVYAEEVSLEAGVKSTEYILNERKEIDGIFYMSDLLAVGGLGYLKRCNIAVPEQIRIVGFDDISIANNTFPRLTTVHQPVEEFGRLAALRIVDMIHGVDIPQQRQRIPVELIVRETT